MLHCSDFERCNELVPGVIIGVWELLLLLLGEDSGSITGAFGIVELKDLKVTSGTLILKEMPCEVLVVFAESVPCFDNLRSVTSSTTVLYSHVSVSSSKNFHLFVCFKKLNYFLFE